MKLFKTALVLAIVATFSIGLVAAYAQPQPGGETKKPAQPPKKDDPKKEEPKKTEPPKKEEQKKEEPKKEAEKPLCPVSGKPINFAVSVPTDEGPVYFCCPECPAKFKADAKKFADKVADQRKLLAKMPRVQVVCPVDGKPIDKTANIEQGGTKIFFCSKDCAEKYKKEADKMKGKLEACYTYQTKCPVTGKDIDPTCFVTAKSGVKVYFCMKDCVGKFEKDMAKYLPELAKQGYTFKADEFKAGEPEKKPEPPKAGPEKKPEPPKPGAGPEKKPPEPPKKP